jgi:hypothetical protein
MNNGIRVWNPQSQLRLDTSDRTLRLTDSIYVPARWLPGATVQTAKVYIPNFNPDKDGAFLSGAEAGYLAYDGPAVEDGFLPAFTPEYGAVNLSWRGYARSYNRTIRYMAFYVKVLRAN